MTKELPRAALIPLLLATAGAAASNHTDAPDLRPTGVLRFGPYDLLRELGRGGMGVVYLAEERDAAHRQVALKVAHQAPATPHLQAQLAFEQHALAALAHDHVVRLFDAGTTPDGHPWLAMEFVDGEPLDAFAARQRLPLAARVRLVATVARAVQHLHERGVVHRDLKPANVLVTEVDGQFVPKLIDLGFAALSTPADDLEPSIVGTPAYMAPELFADPPAAPDPRSDVFALGVILYELIAGRSPFLAATTDEADFDLGATSRHAQPPCARSEAGSAARLRRAGLDAAVLQALAGDPNRRPADAGAFARQLEEVLARAAGGPAAWLRRLLRRGPRAH